MTTLGSRIVLFGGSTSEVGTQNLNDTWTFDGTTWTKASPATPPPPRSGRRLRRPRRQDGPLRRRRLWRRRRHRPLLERDWTFDGTTWTQVQTAVAPSARAFASMAVAGNVLVLFGGIAANGGGFLSDTWTFDGTTWTQSSAAGPTNRIAAWMAAWP